MKINKFALKEFFVKWSDVIGAIIVASVLSMFVFLGSLHWSILAFVVLLPMVFRGIIYMYTFITSYAYPVYKDRAKHKYFNSLVKKGAYREDAFMQVFGMELASEKNTYNMLRQRIIDYYNELANQMPRLKQTGQHAGKNGNDYLEHYYNGKFDQCKELAEHLKNLTGNGK